MAVSLATEKPGTPFNFCFGSVVQATADSMKYVCEMAPGIPMDHKNLVGVLDRIRDCVEISRIADDAPCVDAWGRLEAATISVAVCCPASASQ